MPFQAPRRTALEEDTDERGDERPLLMWTLAATSASLEPTLLASSKSEAGTRIFAGLSWEEVEAEVEELGVVMEALPAVTDSADEVCAEGEGDEEDADETCGGPSGCCGERIGAADDEPEGSDGGAGAEGSMVVTGTETVQRCTARKKTSRRRLGCGSDGM